MAFSFTILIIILIIIIYYLNYHWKQQKILKFFEQFPHSPHLPLIGNALDFRNTTAHLKTLDHYTRKYGGVVSFKIGLSKRFLVVSDYNLVESILSSTRLLTKAACYKFLDPWLEDGILNATGQRWKSLRRFVTPAFHIKVIQDFVDIFDNKSEILLNKLKQIGSTNSIDLDPIITLYSLDVACETASGVPSNVQENDDSDYVKSLKRMCSLLITRSYSAVKSSDFLYRYCRDFYEQKRVIKVLHEHSGKIIRKFFEINSDDRRTSLLSTLLQPTSKDYQLTFKDIREHIDAFIFGAHDTTTSALNFTIYALANHVDVQFKAFEEQRSIFNNDQNAPISYDKLQTMTYLEMVIKESLRMFPPISVVGRRTSEDTNIGELMIPKGVDVLVYIRGIHMNPELYPQPEQFDPNRFSDCIKRPPYAFVPFSAGPRNCLGRQFAMLAMKTVLSKLIRHFEFIPAFPKHQLELASEIVLTSKTGIKVGVRHRTQDDFV